MNMRSQAKPSGGATHYFRHDRASAIAPINRICANRGGAVTFRSARRSAACRLEDLARAAGMSISGIRTAYDEAEIGEVTAITGLAPRRRAAP
jgi:hypothetical protein